MMKIFLLFYMCHFAMSLTHCYKTTGFFTFIYIYIYILNVFTPLGSATIQVFPYQTGWQYCYGNSPNRGVECNGGIGIGTDAEP